jgi:two-component system, chemotaxis family, chemotaxis protein CheY
MERAVGQPGIDVLLVDDDPDVRCTTAEGLREKGYLVRTAANGAEAMALAERSLPSILILDLDMPIMDGREFLDRRRTEGGPLSETPVILITGHTADEEAPAVRRAVEAWLQKPVDVDELAGAIQRLGAVLQIAGRHRYRRQRPLG